MYALTEDQLDLAYPLAREANRNLSLDDWRRFARTRVTTGLDAAAPTGILLAERSGYLRGLAVHDLAEIGGVPILLASSIVVFDSTREQRLALDLLGGLLRIAESARCARVHVELPRSSQWLRARWSDPRGRVFRLPVECSLVRTSTVSHTAERSSEVMDFRTRRKN